MWVIPVFAGVLILTSFGLQDSFADRTNAHELTHTVQQFKLIPVDTDGNVLFGVQCFVRDSSDTPVVGPAGEEIWTDKHGRVKVQFLWDVSQPSNQFVTLTCISEDLSRTERFDTTKKRIGGYNEFVLDDSSGGEDTGQKASKNMILKGKKILQNAKPAPLEECKIITKTSDGDPDRPIIVGSIPNNGLVKLSNISQDRASAEIQCKFEGDRDFGEVIEVELKEKGTTVVIVSEPGQGIPNPD